MNIIKKFADLSKKTKIIIISGAALIILLAVVLCAILLGDSDGKKSDGESSDPDASLISADNDSTEITEKEFSVTVRSEDGMFLEGVTVYVYGDSSYTDLKDVKNTDSDGKVSFVLKGIATCYIKLENTPDGVLAEEAYTLTDADSEIVLTIKLCETEGWEEQTFGKGDVMFDFTVTDTDGGVHTLSELLEDKGTVVLNFWYANCGPCKSEFPHLQKAYEAYSDKLALIAIDPIDNVEAVSAFKAEMELTFPMVAESIDWEKAFSVTGYPTTVVINRYGRIVLYHTGIIPNTDAFMDIFEYFTSDDYDCGVIDNTEDIVSGYSGDDPDEPVVENPTEVGGVTEFELTVRPNEVAYCDVYKVSGMVLQINSENAYVICNGETFEPQNGVVSLMMYSDSTFVPISIGVGNSGEETETFKISFAFPKGTAGNPYSFDAGEFSAQVSTGNNQGVYYEYTATEKGTLTLTCLSVAPNVEYDFSLYNLNSYAYRTNASDGSTDDDGNPVVSIEVRAGDTVQLTVGTLPDENNVYPGATFNFLASFKLSENGDDPIDTPIKTVEYKVKAIYSDGSPVKNMLFKFTANESTVSLMTNSDGEAIVAVSAVSCRVEASPLPGYTVDVSAFELTESAPAKTVTVTASVVSKQNYTVYVKDDSGAPISGVPVSVGASLAETDNSGKAVFSLEISDTYTVFVSLPEDFTLVTENMAFGTGKTLTVVLKKEENVTVLPVELVTYSVTVKDANGASCTNAAVVFLKDGVQAAMQSVNANGVATVKLEEGDYTANIVFSDGAELFYDKGTAILSPEKTSITIVAAPKIANEFTALYLGNAYDLTTGSFYANTKANASTDSSAEGISFFAFTPETSGLYSVSITNPNAELSYWGGNLSFLFDLTSTTDLENNTFTINVKDSNLGITHIIGVKGTDGCVISVERIGNYVPNIDDYEWVIYEAETAPKPFSITLGAGQALTHFDVSGTTADYKLVYNSSDKYYHLGTANGPVVYINLGVDAPFISIKTVLETSGLKKYFYDEDGNFVKKEDYTKCISEYVACIDEDLGIYPLTDDLIYIIKNRGEFEGWWDEDSPNFLLDTVDNINQDIAWMFLLCYIK